MNIPLQRSIYLAKLIAPLMLAVGVGVLFNHAVFRVVIAQMLASPALIFVSGILALVAGVALVLAHNLWVGDWRLIITVLGWLAALGGAWRVIVPQMAVQVGTDIAAHPSGPMIVGAIYLVLGAVLGFYGYPELFAAKKPRRRRQ